MTLEYYTDDDSRVIECPLCDAVMGRDYSVYPRHLERAHGPDDVGQRRPAL